MTNQDNRSKADAVPSAVSGQDLRQKAEALARERAARTSEDCADLSPEEIRKTLHELRVHQIELELQNEELRTAQAVIEAGRARYFDLYDLAPVGYCTLSEKGLILEANLAAATLLGTARGNLIGQRISRFILKEDQNIYYLQHKNLLETGESQECELRLVKPDGTLFWAHLTGTAAQTEDGAPVCRVVLTDITERKQSEKQREILAHKYAAVVIATSDAVVAADLEGRITVFNPGAEKLFGCLADEALGAPIARFCPEDRLAEQAEMMRRVRDDGAVVGYESERLTADGRRIPVEITLSLNNSDQGVPLEINAILRDITIRKQEEDTLRESIRFSNFITHFAQDIIVFKDNNFIFRLVNPAMCNLVGKTENEIVGKTDFDIFPYELAEKYRSDDKYVLESGQSITIEEEVSSYDGIHYVSTTKAPVLDENNACQGIVVIARDITEHKQAEKTLIEREAMFRGMFQDHSAVMLLIDPGTGQIVEANQSAAHYYGYPLEKMLQMNIRQLNLLSPAEIAKNMAGASNRQVTVFEFRHALADGRVRDVEIHTAPVTIQNQILLFSIIHDITERKRAETERQASEDKLSSILDHTRDVVWSLSWPDLSVVYISSSVEVMYGRPIREFYDNPSLWNEVTHPDYKHLTEKALENLWRNGTAERECRILRPDGSTVWIYDKSTIVFDEHNRPIRIDGIASDITGRKRAEEDRLRLERELQHALKAESLGRMTGAIAHLFNNHLAVVLGSLELLEDDLKPNGKGFESLREAQKAARRAAETSALMLTFLGHDIAKREPVNLAEVCRETLSPLNVPLAKNTRLTTGFPAHGPMTRANAAQMKRVLMNLVVNAEESLSGGKGDITVTISVIPAADIHATRIYPAGWEPGDASYACLSITDTGCGMNPETLDRIFDPFFSTRFTGRGLGLPVVLGIVKAHGGAVFVESSPGAGTAVHVLLPLADELPSATAPSPVGVPATPVAGKGLVLVVDDEPAIRSLAQGMLRRLGFEAILAPNGANAVEIFQQRPREIRCILCDLTMPGMNGWETLSALRQIRADIPVVLCSGYDEAAVMADTWADRPQSFLGKPYGMKTLSDSLAKALG